MQTDYERKARALIDSVHAMSAQGLALNQTDAIRKALKNVYFLLDDFIKENDYGRC